MQTRRFPSPHASDDEYEGDRDYGSVVVRSTLWVPWATPNEFTTARPLNRPPNYGRVELNLRIPLSS